MEMAVRKRNLRKMEIFPCLRALKHVSKEGERLYRICH